jgi:hypothetical protein
MDQTGVVEVVSNNRSRAISHRKMLVVFSIRR